MVLQQPPQIKSDDKELCWGTENVWVHLAFTYMQTLDSENLWTPSKNLKGGQQHSSVLQGIPSAQQALTLFSRSTGSYSLTSSMHSMHYLVLVTFLWPFLSIAVSFRSKHRL